MTGTAEFFEDLVVSQGFAEHLITPGSSCGEGDPGNEDYSEEDPNEVLL